MEEHITYIDFSELKEIYPVFEEDFSIPDELLEKIKDFLKCEI